MNGTVWGTKMGMIKENILTQREMMTLASIVQVGDAAYFDLMEAEDPMFSLQVQEETKKFERKKAVLRKEFLSRSPKKGAL